MMFTELFAVFAFLTSSFSPEGLSPSGRGMFSSGFAPTHFYSGVAVSFPPVVSFLPAFLQTLSFGIFGTQVELEVPVAVMNPPVCRPYVSYIARPQFTPVQIIPPPQQPTCLNKRVHPTFEVPALKTPWIIPSPFPPPSKPPMCLPADAPESIWLPLLVAIIVGLATWNFNRIHARRTRRYRSPHLAAKSTVLTSTSWFECGLSAPQRKKIGYRARIVQPRVVASALPSLPAMYNLPHEASSVLGFVPATPSLSIAEDTITGQPATSIEPTITFTEAEIAEASPPQNSLVSSPYEATPPITEYIPASPVLRSSPTVPFVESEARQSESHPTSIVPPVTFVSKLPASPVAEAEVNESSSPPSPPTTPPCQATPPPVCEPAPPIQGCSPPAKPDLHSSPIAPLSDESAAEQSESLPIPTSAPLPTPILESVPPSVPPSPLDAERGVGSSQWASTPSPVLIVSAESPTPAVSSILPPPQTCEDMNKGIYTSHSPSSTSTSPPAPLPAKKKRVRTRGARRFPPDSPSERKTTLLCITTPSKPSTSLSDSIWAPKLTEVIATDDARPVTPPPSEKVSAPISVTPVAPMPSTSSVSLSGSIGAPKSTEVISQAVDARPATLPPSEKVSATILMAPAAPKTITPSTLTSTSDIKAPSKPPVSLSESMWAPKPTEGITKTVNARPVTSPTEKSILSPPQTCKNMNEGIHASRWAPSSTSTSLPAPPPAKKKRVRTRGARRFPPDSPSERKRTLDIEAPSKPLSSLSDSMLTPKSTEAITKTVDARPATPPPSEKVSAPVSVAHIAPNIIAPSTLMTTSDIETPSKTSVSLSGSMWAPKPTVAITKTVATRPATPLPTEKKISTKPVPVTLVALKTIAPSTLTTTSDIKTPSKPSVSLSVSMWAPKPTEAITKIVNARPATPPPTEKKVSAKLVPVTPVTPKTIAPSSLPTPPPTTKKASGLGASMWATEAPSIGPSKLAPGPVQAKLFDEDILFACEHRNQGTSASRWANAPDTPSEPSSSHSARGQWPRGRRGGNDANGWKGKMEKGKISRA